MTKIEWCDLTINPFVGCSKCSPGCNNCYAEKFAARLAKNPTTAKKYAGVIDGDGKWTGTMSQLNLSCFDKLPKSPRRVFIGSMTDFFHERANFDDQGKILARIAHMPQHTFLFLTKRPDRAYRRYHTMLPNVWIGVTVCNQQEADEKLPILMKIPAAKRFVSVEPMLGPVDLHKKELLCKTWINGGFTISTYLDWVICGAETGPHARPMHLKWVRNLRDQCRDADTPFFFKKAGDKIPIPDDLMVREFPCPNAS